MKNCQIWINFILKGNPIKPHSTCLLNFHFDVAISLIWASMKSKLIGIHASEDACSLPSKNPFSLTLATYGPAIFVVIGKTRFYELLLYQIERLFYHFYWKKFTMNCFIKCPHSHSHTLDKKDSWCYIFYILEVNFVNKIFQQVK